MRIAVGLLLAVSCGSLAAQNPEEKEVTAAAQRLFDAMTAHDGDAVRAAMTPDARFISVKDGKASASPGEQFAAHIATITKPLLERIWNPKVLIRGPIAQLWADYDFYFDGKFGHCGVDAFTLVKTSEGWKIAAVADTRETTGCQPSPLGPPAGIETKP